MVLYNWRCIIIDVTVKEVIYKDYGKCVEISNGSVDILATVDSGPRIIRYGFIGGCNEFCDNAAFSKPVPGGEWKIRGGHRLWHSPEHDLRTYVPDNGPVDWHMVKNGILLKQGMEEWAQIEKEMEITLSPESSDVRIVHKLKNKNAWPVELAAWAITVMAAGGQQVIPMPHGDTGLLPDRTISLWPYSRMNDHRVFWGDKYIILKQDPGAAFPFKVGLPNIEGWAAYFNHGNIFIKRFIHQSGANYPDFNSSYETYICDYMMEMESLSPVTRINPECTLEHVEEWKLVKNVDLPRDQEENLSEIVKTHIKP